MKWQWMWEFYGLLCASDNHSVQDWNVDNVTYFLPTEDEKFNLGRIVQSLVSLR